jgi:hypothetical protein
MEILHEYIRKNLARGWIRRSTSQAGALILFTKKKNRALQLCIDYRGLNAITIKNWHPLPLIQESLDRLGYARVYTKLDLQDAYHRIRIKEGDEWKIAFRTRYGHFKYTVVPFGLTNTPAVFQSYINSALSDLLNECCIVYLNDILIYSNSEEEHERHVNLVLDRLICYKLYAKLSKYEFHCDRIRFLGYVVIPEGVIIEPEQIDTVQSWPEPTCVRDIRLFIGFANYYRRFIKGFSRIASPLNKLTEKRAGSASGGHKQRKEESIPIVLPSEALESFRTLKAAFLSNVILAHFQPELPIRVETDASGYAISAILSQPYRDSPKGTKWRPVAFFSRKMTAAERNYDTHDGELLAIIEAFKAWRHYLEGS